MPNRTTSPTCSPHGRLLGAELELVRVLRVNHPPFQDGDFVLIEEKAVYAGVTVAGPGENWGTSGRGAPSGGERQDVEAGLRLHSFHVGQPGKSRRGGAVAGRPADLQVQDPRDPRKGGRVGTG